MLSEKTLLRELSRLPRLIKVALKDGDLESVIEMRYEMLTLEWILTDKD